MYYIAIDGKSDGKILFMQDRNKSNNSYFGTLFLKTALEYKEYSNACSTVRKLKYNNPRIVTSEEAVLIEMANIDICNNIRNRKVTKSTAALSILDDFFKDKLK